MSALEFHTVNLRPAGSMLAMQQEATQIQNAQGTKE